MPLTVRGRSRAAVPVVKAVSGNGNDSETIERFARNQAVLLALAKRDWVREDSSLERSFAVITEAAAVALDVERVGVWLFTPTRDAILASDYYHLSMDIHSRGSLLRSDFYPSYFAALEENRMIAADDARSDPRTREFRERYLDPNGIVSMLDAPIRAGGRMAGVLCHEHVGIPRVWSLDDQTLAASLADITALVISLWEHEQTAVRLQSLERKMHEAQRFETLGVLAASIGHDFNNLLNPIRGWAQLALAELPEGSGVREAIEEILKATTRARTVAGQIADFANRGGRKPETVTVAEIVSELASLIRVTVPRNVRFEIGPVDADLRITGDRVQLQQVILNLIANGVDAIGSRQGTVSISVRAADAGNLPEGAARELASSGRHVLVSVADSGHGMSPGTLQNVFKPLFTTKKLGHGLGLAAARGIVENHGGWIWCESEAGRGSAFHVLLPAAGSGVRSENAVA